MTFNSVWKWKLAPAAGSSKPSLLVALLLLAHGVTGCRTVPPLPAVDLSQPGWEIRQGQATWRPKRGAVEIAGELLVASGRGDDCFLQFTKIPLPFVVAQIMEDAWQVEFPSENKRYSGHGAPPSRVAWFQLMRGAQGKLPAAGWRFDFFADNRWRLENAATGEIVEGYLAPALRRRTP